MKDAILLWIAAAVLLMTFLGLPGFCVGFVVSLVQGETVGQSFRNALGVAWDLACNVLSNGPPH